MTKPATPELDKQSAIIASGRTQAIGEFLDWLFAKEITLCVWEARDDEYLPYNYGSYEHLLADHFDIDLDKVEQERRALLDYCRSLNDD